jgi:hypothetical protein
MCNADAVSDIDAQRAALVAELMAEMTQLRAEANAIAHEIHRQVMEDPANATAEASLRFQRMVSTVTRIGGFQLLLLEKAGTFSEAAEQARERKAAAAQRERAKAGKELKARCVYLFDKEVLTECQGRVAADDLSTMRRDLFSWMFDTDDALYASRRVGDVMIEMTRAVGLDPGYGPDETAEWETAVRRRWAPLDDNFGDDNFGDTILNSGPAAPGSTGAKAEFSIVSPKSPLAEGPEPFP